MSNMMMVDIGSIDCLRYRRQLIFGSGARSADDALLRNTSRMWARIRGRITMNSKRWTNLKTRMKSQPSHP